MDFVKEQIDETLDAAVALAEAMAKKEELITVTAVLSKKYLDAYIRAGFTRQEAVQIVAHLSGKSGN